MSSTIKSNSVPNSWMFPAAIVGGAFVLQRAAVQAGKGTPTVASGSQAVPTIEDSPRARDRRMRAPLRGYFGLAEPPEPAPGLLATLTQPEQAKVAKPRTETSSLVPSPGKGVTVDGDLAKRLLSVDQRHSPSPFDGPFFEPLMKSARGGSASQPGKLRHVVRTPSSGRQFPRQQLMRRTCSFIAH